MRWQSSGSPIWNVVVHLTLKDQSVDVVASTQCTIRRWSKLEMTLARSSFKSVSRDCCNRGAALRCRTLRRLATSIAVFPQTDFPRIVIIVDNGEAPASQTLVSVTRPIEEAMNGIPGIARIKSKTARGSSEINLYFDWNGDIIQELQLVQARMSQLLSTLPPTAEIRNIERLTFACFP
jgi:hypothetical protein